MRPIRQSAAGCIVRGTGVKGMHTCADTASNIVEDKMVERTRVLLLMDICFIIKRIPWYYYILF